MSALFPHGSGHHATILRIEWWLEQLAFGLLLMMVGWLPWVFSRMQLDTVELPKQTVLIVSAGLVWFLLVVQDALRGAWHLVWDRSAKILAFSLLVLALGTVLSRDLYGSWVGITKQIPTAMLSLIAVYAWWLAIRRLVQTPLRLGLLVGVWLVSAGILAWGTLAWLLGATIWPWSLEIFRVVTPAGAVSEVASFLIVPTLISLVLIIQGKTVTLLKQLRLIRGLGIAGLVVLIPSVFLIGMVGSLGLWLALAAGAKMFAIIANTRRVRAAWIAVAAISLLSAMTLFMPTVNPWSKLASRVSITVPAEVALGTRVSWSMAFQGLKEHPLVGRGAGTWVSLFLTHRDPALNASPFANIRFFQAASSAATVVGTLGLLGILASLAWLLLPGIVVLRSYKQEHESVLPGVKWALLPLWLASVVIWFTLPFATVHLFFFWLLSALLVNTQASPLRGRVFHFDHPGKGILPLTLATLAAFVCSWIGMQRFLAEQIFVAGKDALAAQKYALAEERLLLAHAWNPWTDVYTSLLSQTYLQAARAELAQNPSPARLSAITSLLQRSEQLSAEAREQYSDRVETWLAAASIASTRNLLIAPALRTNTDIVALTQAQTLDPSNPQIALLIANAYTQQADTEQNWLTSSDEKVKATARARFNDEIEKATIWFVKADALQPGLAAVASGRAHLALLKGDTEGAIHALETLERQGNQTQELKVQLALLYEQAGKTDLAMRLLEAIVKDHIQDASPLARWTLARLYAGQDRLEESLVLIEGLAQQFPKESLVQQQLAELRRARLEAEREKITPPTTVTSTVTVPSKTPVKSRAKRK
jgi:hypothetical protein